MIIGLWSYLAYTGQSNRLDATFSWWDRISLIQFEATLQRHHVSFKKTNGLWGYPRLTIANPPAKLATWIAADCPPSRFSIYLAYTHGPNRPLMLRRESDVPRIDDWHWVGGQELGDKGRVPSTILDALRARGIQACKIRSLAYAPRPYIDFDRKAHVGYEIWILGFPAESPKDGEFFTAMPGKPRVRKKLECYWDKQGIHIVDSDFGEPGRRPIVLPAMPMAK